jgi:WD40 repeat protein
MNEGSLRYPSPAGRLFERIIRNSGDARRLGQIAQTQAPTPSAPTDRNTRVFLSYSRKDSEFAKWLRHGLQEGQIDVFQDVEDTLPGEEWWRRLQGLITQSDTVIFVLSPHSVSSTVCRNEVAHALKLNKRVFPVVIEDINWATAPDGLIKLHGVFFNDVGQRDESLKRLIEALQTDIAWIREHTRLGELAQHWDTHGRPAGDLLRGRPLEEAEHWLTQRPKTARSPSNLQQQYIRASRTAARKWARTLVAASLAVAIATSSLGIVAFLQKTEVQRREGMLLVQKSRMLTEFARQNLRDEDAVTAALLAGEALPDETDSSRPYYPSAEFVLHKALRERRERLVLGGTQYIVREAIFSPDERFVLTAENDGRVRIWDAAAGNEVGELKPQGKRGARTVQYSPDGRKILVGYDDGIARVFDATTRELLRELRTPSTSIRVAVFSPDGRRILTAGEEDSGTLWDVTTGKVEITFAGRGLTVEGAAFNADGTMVVTVSNDRTARIWNTHDGTEFTRLRAEVRNAVFSPDGQQILTASDDSTARLWDANGKEITTLVGHDARVLFVDFSPDGKHIVTTSADKTARLWDFPPQDAEPLKSHALLGHAESVQKAIFSGDSKRLLSISDDLSIRVWQVTTGALIATLKGHQRIITSATFSHDGRTVLTASEDDTARIWTIEPTADFFALDGEEAAVFGSFRADGKQLVTTFEDGTVRIWNSETEPSPERRLKGHDQAVVSAYFSSDATEILTASLDGTARIWDLKSGRELARLEPDKSPLSNSVYSPDERFVLTATQNGLATLWQAGKRVKDFKSNDSELFSAAFSPKGEKIVTASDNHARIWDIESGKLLAALDGHTGACRTAAFSSDGRWVLTAGDTTVRVWDSTTGASIRMHDVHARVLAAEVDPQGHHVLIVAQRKPFAYLWDLETDKVLELSGAAAGSPEDGAHTEQVTRAVFTADGRRIVTASKDASVRVWDTQTRAPIDVLRHPKAVSYMAVSPDMRWIATMSWDGTTRLWRNFVSTQAFVAEAENEIPRCLTSEQRQKFGLTTRSPSWCQTRPR